MRIADTGRAGPGSRRLGFAAAAQAQQYPTKPIRMIVSIAAGSVTDVIMRAAAAELQAGSASRW